jgi:hypothetical protein
MPGAMAGAFCVVVVFAVGPGSGGGVDRCAGGSGTGGGGADGVNADGMSLLAAIGGEGVLKCSRARSISACWTSQRRAICAE